MPLSLTLHSAPKPLEVALVALIGSLACLQVCHGASAFDEANKKSVQGLNAMPRYGGVDSLNANITGGDSGEAGAYAIGVVSTAIIFLIFALLAFLVWPFWCALRMCHCCCCKRTKQTEESTFLRKYGFIIFILLNCALIISFSVIAYVANQEFSDAVVDKDDGVLTTVDVFLDDLNDFVNETIFEPLTFIKRNTIDAVRNVSTLLDGSSVITDGTENLVEALTNFSQTWGNKSVNVSGSGSNVYTFECGVCTEIAKVIAETRDQITDETDPLFDELDDTITDINDKLIDVNATIVSQVSKVSNSMGKLSDTLNDFGEKYDDDYVPMIEDINAQRELSYVILFTTPLIAFIPVLLGTFLKMPACFTLAYSLMWFNFFIMFFMLTLHLPIALLLNDVCNFLDDNDDNLVALYNNTFGELAQSCLDDTPVAQVFGIEDDLDFVNIEFATGNSSEITSAFEFGSLSNFTSTMNNTDSGTFDSGVAAMLEVVNGLVDSCVCTGGGSSTDHFTSDNISALIVSEYYDQSVTVERSAYASLNNSRFQTIDMITASDNSEVKFDNILGNITADLNRINNMTNDLEVSIETYFDRIGTAQVVLKPIFRKAKDVIHNGTCGFMGNAYRDLNDSICTDILAALSTMVLCMLLIGIFSFLACIASIKMVRRIRPLMDDSASVASSVNGGTAGGGAQQQVIVLKTSGNSNTSHLYASEA